MVSYDINSLSDEQKQPLFNTEGAVLVTAGAGSGKTRLLTHRIVYIIENGTSPYNILAITFTNKATNEMRERLLNMTEGANEIWISTFHSMCAKILRREIEALGYTRDFTIYSESDQDKVIKLVLEELNENDEKMKKLLSFHLSNWKNGILPLEKYAENEEDEDFEIILKAIKRYEEILKENNALDFDDLLIKTYTLFKNNPDILYRYSNRFKYILVDEFQDTNIVQYELLKQLSFVHKNIFAVGDEDQCIYSWRGANFENIFNFKRDFQNVKVYKLERNYRSTSGILDVANTLIKNNVSRFDKKLWTEKETGDKPVIYNASEERDEAGFVAKNISKLLKEGYNFDDFAILMRVNALSRSFEEALLSYNIPHRIYGGFKFFERAEIKNIIAYLRLFVNPKDDVSFERIVNFPRRAIGEGSVRKIRENSATGGMLKLVLSGRLDEIDAALSKKLRLFVDTFNNLKALKDSLGLTDFIKNVITSFDIRSAYNPKDDDELNKLMNIDSLISSVSEFEEKNQGATLSEYLESITLMSDSDEIGASGAVTIATIHAVKGLEFKVVFVVGCEEGIFPGARALGSNKSIEEERRLMYVAVTRAEEKLFVSYSSKRYIYGQTRFEIPSRFVKELGIINKEKVEPLKEKPKIYNPLQFFRREEEKNENKKDVSIYKIGQKVRHPRFGDGVIFDISSDHLVGDINFEGVGNKSLMLEIAPLEILSEE